MPDRSHAGNAKARASEEERKGVISRSTEKKIDAKANKVLKKKGTAARIGDQMMGKSGRDDDGDHEYR